MAKASKADEIPSIPDSRVKPLPRKGYLMDAHGKCILSECIVHDLSAAGSSGWAVIEDPDGTIRGASCKQIRFEKPDLPVKKKPVEEPAPASKGEDKPMDTAAIPVEVGS